MNVWNPKLESPLIELVAQSISLKYPFVTLSKCLNVTFGFGTLVNVQIDVLILHNGTSVFLHI